MDILERYLRAVQFWLPRSQQRDIIAELREDLSSQIEDMGYGIPRHGLGPGWQSSNMSNL